MYNLAYPYYQPQQSGMMWVSNEQEAFSYPVAPNNAVALWDSSKPTVYVKQADASGKPFVKVLDYTERNAPTSVSDGGGSSNTIYALKSDVDKILTEIQYIKKKLKGDTDDT